MTREQELINQIITERAHRLMADDAMNPDVGMGLFWDVAMREAQEQLEMKFTDL